MRGEALAFVDAAAVQVGGAGCEQSQPLGAGGGVEEVFPVCSPQFRETLPARPGADEVVAQPLLHDIYWDTDWPDWGSPPQRCWISHHTLLRRITAPSCFTSPTWLLTKCHILYKWREPTAIGAGVAPKIGLSCMST